MFWKNKEKAELEKSSTEYSVDHWAALGYDYLGYDEFHWVDTNGKITENIYVHFFNSEEEKYLRTVVHAAKSFNDYRTHSYYNGHTLKIQFGTLEQYHIKHPSKILIDQMLAQGWVRDTEKSWWKRAGTYDEAAGVQSAKKPEESKIISISDNVAVVDFSKDKS